MKNYIIAIEGIDGSGKGTQASLLENYFKEKKCLVKLISFPRYSDTFFGKEIGNYLNGSFGTIEQIHPKFVAMLYACDRYETKNMIINYLKQGHILIFDRYVSSNIAYQAAKLPDKERLSFIKWIYHMEYEVFNLPKPDIEIFLNIPFSLSKKMVAKKKKRVYTNNKHDLHEENEKYLQQVSKIFCNISKKNKWLQIDCFDKNNIRNKKEILDDIIFGISMLQ